GNIRPLVRDARLHLFGNLLATLPRELARIRIAEERVWPVILPRTIDRHPERRIRDVANQPFSSLSHASPIAKKFSKGLPPAVSKKAKPRAKRGENPNTRSRRYASANSCG